MEVKYATESAQGFIRLYKVIWEHQRDAQGNPNYNEPGFWKEEGEICRRETSKLEDVQPIEISQEIDNNDEE